MSYTLVPPGYRAVLLGSASNIEDLGTFAPLEESLYEGALVLVRLDFAEPPIPEALNQLEQACHDAQVEMWPGYDHIVHAGETSTSVYLAWQKGFAWTAVIVGLLVTVVLPPLLGSLVWLILPESVKTLITNIINLGMLALIMFVMMQVMKPLTIPAKEKPKKLEEAKS